MMKRGVYGTYHRLSPKHLDRYVDEFAGRHNMRSEDTVVQMQSVARGILGGQLRYLDLTADNGRSPTAQGNQRMNWKHQTMWTSDNLNVMRGMNSESVDLIYLDPPFNSKTNYAAPIGSQAAGAAFKDTWGLDEINLAWHGLIKSDYPALYELLGAVKKVHGDSMMAYLIYMAIRIMEMKRILKTTGNICVHCDTAASHYLKLLIDALFHHENFESEVIWRRTGSHNSTRSFGRMHETILWYHKSKRYTFNVVRTPYTKGHVESRYTIGPDGRARFSSGGNVLTGAGVTSGPSCEPWRGFDPSYKGATLGNTTIFRDAHGRRLPATISRG